MVKVCTNCKHRIGNACLKHHKHVHVEAVACVYHSKKAA